LVFIPTHTLNIIQNRESITGFLEKKVSFLFELLVGILPVYGYLLYM